MTTRQAELVTVQFAKLLVKMERLLRQISYEDAVILLEMLGRKIGEVVATPGATPGANFGEVRGSQAGNLPLVVSSSSASNGNGSSEEQRQKNLQLRTDAREVLRFLNEKTGRSFRFVDTNLRLIEARLRSGATVPDCKGVIARKCRDWTGDPVMNKYLRPETLFSALKFEQYIGEKETV